MQGGEEIGAIGARRESPVGAPTGPQRPSTPTENVASGKATTTAGSGTVSTNSAGSGGLDVLALSGGLTTADAQAQAARAAELLRIVGKGASAVNVNELARVLEREGVVVP